MLSIITTYAWTGSAYVVPSAMAKAGVLAMTRSLAVEWGGRGVRLNAIAPGPVPHAGRLGAAGAASRSGASVRDEESARTAWASIGELANLAAFLLCDGARYINGEVVTIDGGEWLQGAGSSTSWNG